VTVCYRQELMKKLIGNPLEPYTQVYEVTP
jgi:hypothetical protein